MSTNEARVDYRLVDALIARCVRELGNGLGRVMVEKAASWFCDNVDDSMSAAEWGAHLRAFTEEMKYRGHLDGH